MMISNPTVNSEAAVSFSIRAVFAAAILPRNVIAFVVAVRPPYVVRGDEFVVQERLQKLQFP